MYLLNCLFVFAAVFLLDWLWAFYVKTTVSSRALQASTIASTLFLISGWVTTLYVDDKTLLLPAALGAFAGTFVATRKVATRKP